MKKEILTVADCKARVLEANDVTSVRFRKVIFHFVGLSVVCSGGITAVLCLPLGLIEGAMPIWVSCLIALVCVIPAAVLLSVLFVNLSKHQKRFQKIQQYGVEMVEDTFNDIHIVERYKGKQYTQVYVLTFRDSGRYEVPDREHYRWSKLYAMSPYGIYNTSHVGDTFYLLRLKDTPKYEILDVYNANLFELCPDGTEARTSGSWHDSVNLE